MPKFTAVGGKSGTARIVSVHAETKDAARAEINRQLLLNPQRREIWKQWQASGAAIVSEVLEDEISEAEASFDEAQANALIRGRLSELLAELDADCPEVVAIHYAIRNATEALNAFERGMEDSRCQ